ncbi:MAG: pyruvate phosphate dikinase, partial [Dehalococcoidia bacterium]|nr:pyruvate phosphate dikinase [Dehalococcoidia bacterium]
MLRSFQMKDFLDILKTMAGKPVVIRLLDPPLHEFLPKYEELLADVVEMRTEKRLGVVGPGLAQDLEEKEALLHAIEEMREANPMLGLRGCRLGLMYGAINEMQAWAIMSAACELKSQGYDPRPEIMVPLVGYLTELTLVKDVVTKVCEQVQDLRGVRVAYKVGTMIEL